PERRLVSLWKQVNSRLVSFLILNGRLPTTGDELFNTFNGLPSGLHAVPVGDDLYLKVDLDHRNGIIRLERKPSIDLVDVNYVKTNFVRETQTAKQELIDESAIPKDAKFEPLLTLAFQAE
ncbi:MAG TPA: hypothetical protein VEI97_16030, partial [bacterium]|nr:hypothetical protein [bacterium]